MICLFGALRGLVLVLALWVGVTVVNVAFAATCTTGQNAYTLGAGPGFHGMTQQAVCTAGGSYFATTGTVSGNQCLIGGGSYEIYKNCDPPSTPEPPAPSASSATLSAACPASSPCSWSLTIPKDVLPDSVTPGALFKVVAWGFGVVLFFWALGFAASAGAGIIRKL